MTTKREAISLEALKIVCRVLAAARDGESLPDGWLEDLKYSVVDRAIEFMEPGFDGGKTSAKEARESFARFKADLKLSD